MTPSYIHLHLICRHVTCALLFSRVWSRHYISRCFSPALPLYELHLCDQSIWFRAALEGEKVLNVNVPALKRMGRFYLFNPPPPRWPRTQIHATSSTGKNTHHWSSMYLYCWSLFTFAPPHVALCQSWKSCCVSCCYNLKRAVQIRPASSLSCSPCLLFVESVSWSELRRGLISHPVQVCIQCRPFFFFFKKKGSVDIGCSRLSYSFASSLAPVPCHKTELMSGI